MKRKLVDKKNLYCEATLLMEMVIVLMQETKLILKSWSTSERVSVHCRAILLSLLSTHKTVSSHGSTCVIAVYTCVVMD